VYALSRDFWTFSKILPKILDREITGLIFKEVHLGDPIQLRIGMKQGGCLG